MSKQHKVIMKRKTDQSKGKYKNSENDIEKALEFLKYSIWLTLIEKIECLSDTLQINVSARKFDGMTGLSYQYVNFLAYKNCPASPHPARFEGSPSSDSSRAAVEPKIYEVVKVVTSGPVDYSNKARDDNLLWHKCLLSSLYILLRKPLLYFGATVVKKWSTPSERLYDNGGLCV